MTVFTVAKESGGVFALTIDTQYGNFTFLKTGQMIGAAGMCHVVFNGIEFNVIPINTEFIKQASHLFNIATIVPIAVKNSAEGPFGRVPISLRIVPPRLTQETDFAEREGYNVHVFWSNTRLLQTPSRSVQRHGVFRMFLAGEAFFFCCSY